MSTLTELRNQNRLVKLSAEEQAGLEVAISTLSPEEQEAVATAVESGQVTAEEAVNEIVAAAEERIAAAEGGAEVLDLVPEETKAELIEAVETGQITPEEGEATYHEINEQIADVVADALEEQLAIEQDLAAVEQPQA